MFQFLSLKSIKPIRLINFLEQPRMHLKIKTGSIGYMHVHIMENNNKKNETSICHQILLGWTIEPNISWALVLKVTEKKEIKQLWYVWVMDVKYTHCTHFMSFLLPPTLPTDLESWISNTDMPIPRKITNRLCLTVFPQMPSEWTLSLFHQSSITDFLLGLC